MSFFPDSRATIIGLPESFDILSELSSANSIRLATAFAHKSGWELLSSAITTCKGNKFVLAGSSFFQTEPEILRIWLELSNSPQFRASLHIDKSVTFHPKVLIVHGEQPFAIVGSGNLSRGGLQTNIECSAFISSDDSVAALTDWFDEVFGAAAPLKPSIVEDYERKWKTLRPKKEELRKTEQSLEERFKKNTEAVMKQWDGAVRSAKQYFGSRQFRTDYISRQNGAALIRKHLKYPLFEFGKSDWEGFYSVLSLGHLIPLYRDRVYQKKHRLQTGLKALVAPNANTLSVVNELLQKNGKYHIDGFGLNAISKVLSVHNPLAWVVYNSPVHETLKSFGYVSPRRASAAEKYGAFVKMMEKFKTETGAQDAFALDAYFYYYFKTHPGDSEKAAATAAGR